MYSLSQWIKHPNVIGFLGLVLAVTYLILYPEISSSFSIARIYSSVDTTQSVGVGNLAAEYRKGCPQHQFTSVRILSRAPDIILIEGFVTPAEAEFLVKIADPLFGESPVLDYGESNESNNKIDKGHRDSFTAFLNVPSNPAENDNDVIVKCIEERAARFQGHVLVKNLESLQLVKYHETQQFRGHFDWLDPYRDTTLERYGNRETSFFVYLETNCTGGNTVFPDVPLPQAPEWCDSLACLDENGEEVNRVEVIPKVGRAIFWYNLDAEGNVDRKTFHAGAPVISGTKVGMNIWTRERHWRP